MNFEEIPFRVREFEEILMEAVDKGLRILGHNMDRVIYYWISKNYSLKREEIPKRLDKFIQCLYEMFGLGASIIEGEILKNLFYRLGLRFREKEGYDFLDYVEEARRIYPYIEWRPEDDE